MTEKITIPILAEQLGVSKYAVLRKVKKLFPDKVQNGKTTYLDKAETLLIKEAFLAKSLEVSHFEDDNETPKEDDFFKRFTEDLENAFVTEGHKDKKEQKMNKEDEILSIIRELNQRIKGLENKVAILEEKKKVDENFVEAETTKLFKETVVKDITIEEMAKKLETPLKDFYSYLIYEGLLEISSFGVITVATKSILKKIMYLAEEGGKTQIMVTPEGQKYFLDILNKMEEENEENNEEIDNYVDVSEDILDSTGKKIGFVRILKF